MGFSNPTASPKLSLLHKHRCVFTLTQPLGHLRHWQAAREKPHNKTQMSRVPTALPREAIPLFQDRGRCRRHHGERLLSAWPSSRATTQTAFLCLPEPITQPQEGTTHQPSPALAVLALLCSARQVPILPGLDSGQQTSKETGESQPGPCSRGAGFRSAACFFPERRDKTLNLLTVYYSFSH